MKRTVANIHVDTRKILDEIKGEYNFKSDDHAIKFMCTQFIKSPFAENLKLFQSQQKNKEQ